jgi:hypothetical protein
MDWVLKVVERVLLHPEDLERRDEDAMQAWKDLRALLKRALPAHDRALVRPLVEALRSYLTGHQKNSAHYCGCEYCTDARAALAPYKKTRS